MHCPAPRDSTSRRLQQPSPSAPSSGSAVLGKAGDDPIDILTSYAGKIVDAEGELMFIATYHETPDGDYIGTISDPVPIVVGADGSIAPVHQMELP